MEFGKWQYKIFSSLFLSSVLISSGMSCRQDIKDIKYSIHYKTARNSEVLAPLSQPVGSLLPSFLSSSHCLLYIFLSKRVMQGILSSQVQSHRQPHGHPDVRGAAVDLREGGGDLGGLRAAGTSGSCVFGSDAHWGRWKWQLHGVCTLPSDGWITPKDSFSAHLLGLLPHTTCYY